MKDKKKARQEDSRTGREKLNPDKIRYNGINQRYYKTKDFWLIDKQGAMYYYMSRVWHGPAFVEINYRIPVPRILRVGQVIGYAFGADGWDEWINITARNEVFNGTWMPIVPFMPITPRMDRSRS